MLYLCGFTGFGAYPYTIPSPFSRWCTITRWCIKNRQNPTQNRCENRCGFVRITQKSPKQGLFSVAVNCINITVFIWRCHPDLNRGWRFCRPRPYRLAMAPCFAINKWQLIIDNYRSRLRTADLIKISYCFQLLYVVLWNFVSGKLSEKRKMKSEKWKVQTCCTNRASAHLFFSLFTFSFSFLPQGKFGADNEARTRYLHLGKVALYQMSYARIVAARN